MMSIFSSPYYAPQTSEPSLVPLFRLLDDYDHYSRQVEAAQPKPQIKKRRQSPARLPTFKPKFDVRETETAYELHGELPGIERENLNIEFTDHQTIVIRGRVERTKEQQPQPATETEKTTPEAAETETEKPTSRRNSFQATVEDDPEETASNASWTSVGSPKPETAKPAKKPSTEAQKTAPKKEQTVIAANNTSKIWLWERSIGEFSRTFSFPSPVDHEGVSADLNNGVLTVTVPKRKIHSPRRIAIL